MVMAREERQVVGWCRERRRKKVDLELCCESLTLSILGSQLRMADEDN
jgi:hypothetical protein